MVVFFGLDQDSYRNGTVFWGKVLLTFWLAHKVALRPGALRLRPVGSGTFSYMAGTRLSPDPGLVMTRPGRERMIGALGRLYREVEIEGPPRVVNRLIVIPEEPKVVYLALQRVAPDWLELFALSPSA